MAMEGQFARPVSNPVLNPVLGLEVEARLRPQIVSELSAIGIISGLGLAVGVLVLALPFSEQIAMSLSLLS